MLWAKPVWNAYWTWETKLTFSVLQLLMYLAYLMLRSGFDDSHKRARFSAVYALMGAVLIPFNFLISRVLNSIHPAVFGPSVNATQQGDHRWRGAAGSGGRVRAGPQVVSALEVD